MSRYDNSTELLAQLKALVEYTKHDHEHIGPCMVGDDCPYCPAIAAIAKAEGGAS